MEYKYAIAKIVDIDNLLERDDQQKMYQMLNIINMKRELAGKSLNSYVVINTDEPYIAEVIEILKKYGHWGHSLTTSPIKLDISFLQKEVHQNAINKGWYDEPRSFGDVISLMHSELSEALEDHRNGHDFKEVYFEGAKPCGIPTELADTVIRIMDTCEHLGIDLGAAIRQKMDYNATRPQRHGGKLL